MCQGILSCPESYLIQKNTLRRKAVKYVSQDRTPPMKQWWLREGRQVRMPEFECCSITCKLLALTVYLFY